MTRFILSGIYTGNPYTFRDAGIEHLSVFHTRAEAQDYKAHEGLWDFVVVEARITCPNTPKINHLRQPQETLKNV